MNKSLVKINIFVGTFGHMSTMIFGFIIQKCFLNYLGLEILGINGVITDVLGLLNLAELGVGNAIIYRLYKPIIEEDYETIGELMQLYRRIYCSIGCFIFLLGSVFSLLLPYLMKDVTSSRELIYSAFFVQLFTTSFSYFMAYKSSMFLADQRRFVIKIIDFICTLFSCIARIMVLVFLHNYILYLFILLGQTMAKNALVTICYNKYYLKKIKRPKRKYNDVQGIFRDTKDIIFGKLVNYVYNSTDNIIVSIIIGVANVGSLSSYKMVTKSVYNLIHSMTDSLVATVGNYVNSNSTEKSFLLLKRYSFAKMIIINIACVGIYVCMKSFIVIFYGQNYALSDKITGLLVADLFLGMLYGPLSDYITALGYFKYEKKISVVGALINIFISIIGALTIGIEGVLFGTCCSQIFFLIAKSILLCKKYFDSTEKLYDIWKSYLKFLIIIVIEVISVKIEIYVLGVPVYSIVGFLMQIMLIIITIIVCVLIFYGKSDEFLFFKNEIIVNKLKRNKN